MKDRPWRLVSERVYRVKTASVLDFAPTKLCRTDGVAAQFMTLCLRVS